VKVMTLILKAVVREVMVWNSKTPLESWTMTMASNSSYQHIKSLPATYLTYSQASMPKKLSQMNTTRNSTDLSLAIAKLLLNKSS